MTAAVRLEDQRLGDLWIGPGHPVFVIAEIGLNHNGDPEIAAELIRAAAQAGANAVKFQKRDTRALLTREQYDSPYDVWYAYGHTYGAHREALEFSVSTLAKLRDLATDLGLVFFASAWDLPSVDACEELGVPLYKVASADVTNIPLLDRMVATGKPVLMSSGMSTEEEVDDALTVLRAGGADVVLLHAVSTYPAEFEEVNLAAIPWLQVRFDCPVGYSGHERGIAVSTAAVALGACAVERHFTLDRTMKGPDHAASLEPPGMQRLVRDIRVLEKAMGEPGLHIVDREVPVRRKLAKSLVASRALPAGHRLEPGDLVAKSPGDGMSPRSIHQVMGRFLARALEEDEQLRPEYLG
jgi:sialic acid synthase